ncbi:MAG: hypothetical protein R3321_03410 [Nitrososphaeraceae archaeon]|nr:hypothetical protein [Nitrososphaeraceae archaeon]
MEQYPELETRLNKGSKIIHSQLAKLRILDNKFSTRDKELTIKVTTNLKNGGKDKAKVIAQELVHIRKIKHRIRKLSLALEIIAIRFSTISEFAHMLYILNPMIDIIKEVKTEISNTVPETKRICTEMSSLTSGILIDTNIKVTNNPIGFEVDSDALTILNEVQTLIEDQTKVKLPAVPIIDNSQKELSHYEVSEKKPLLI